MGKYESVLDFKNYNRCTNFCIPLLRIDRYSLEMRQEVMDDQCHVASGRQRRRGDVRRTN